MLCRIMVCSPLSGPKADCEESMPARSFRMHISILFRDFERLVLRLCLVDRLVKTC